MESTQHPNQSGSVILGLATIIIYAVAVAYGWYVHHLPDLWVVGLLAAATIVSAIINISNTFETNADWKTYQGIAVIIATILVFFVTVSQYAK